MIVGVKNLKQNILFFLELFFLLASNVLYFFHYGTVAYIADLRHIDFGKYLLTSFDKWIPYVDWFLPFYLFGFFFPFLILISLLITKVVSIDDIRKIACAMFMLISFAFVIYLVFPTSMSPLIESLKFSSYNNFLFAEFFSNYNKHSMPNFNAFPSLHVGIPWLMLLSLSKYLRLDNLSKKIFAGIMWVIFLCIVLATVTLKYHYTLDLFLGTIAAYFSYYVAIKADFFRTNLWSEFFGVRHLLFMEAMVFSIILICYIIAYPTYMQIGH